MTKDQMFEQQKFWADEPHNLKERIQVQQDSEEMPYDDSTERLYQHQKGLPQRPQTFQQHNKHVFVQNPQITNSSQNTFLEAAGGQGTNSHDSQLNKDS